MLKIGDKTFQSRLLLGTGKFSSLEIQRKAVEAAQPDILTFAVRRLDIWDPEAPNYLEQLDLKRFTLLPNTAGATTVQEAVRIARLARASKLCDMIKVEIIGDPVTFLPDPIATLEATRILVEEGFTVLPYISDDPILARRLEEVGAHGIMPGGSPIGSGQGLLNPFYLRIIIEQAKVPVIIDAGIGSPADAAQAMELGADGVLLNMAVAGAEDPVKMAQAMKMAVEAGRLGYEAGRIPKREVASASSPSEGKIES